MKMQRHSGNRNPLFATRRAGISLLEIIILIVLVAGIILLAVPWIYSARSVARKKTCEQNLVDLWGAIDGYYGVRQSFPAGAIYDHDLVPLGEDVNSRSWGIDLLPAVLDRDIAEEFTVAFLGGESITSPDLKARRQKWIPRFLCPSDDLPPRSQDGNGYAQSNYAGSYDHRSLPIETGTSGTLLLNKALTVEDIPDGVGYTILIGEIRRSSTDLGWASGTRGMMRNAGTPMNKSPSGVLSNDASVGAVAGDPGGFGSFHRGGCHFMFANGSVKFQADSIDPAVYLQQANRDDAKAGRAGEF
ncbi:DUF1559 family PulG-like putative transporter [Planctomicrobium sp. SH527]|uniref:DUF1559 family PulG-like putative transporter n=1 Tax=Planctomicrobium sp. SH527 TaxID=3448123 RepID=UPI003F5C6636